MRCGLYGKVPAKRDFVAVAAPRAFLRLVEPWLERGLAETHSRVNPEDWAGVFAAAPVWRFWLADELCHQPVIGVMAPSMDACGRSFPLILFCIADGRESIVPPWLDPHGAWFEQAEDCLATWVDPRASCEAPPQGQDRQGRDRQALDRHELDRLAIACDPAAGRCADDDAWCDRIASLVKERKDAGLASRSVWWSVDAAGRGPVVRIEAGMPDPIAFSEMLTFRRLPQPEPAIQVTP